MYKMLIVEDEMIQATALAAIVKECDYSFVTDIANNMVDALDKLNKEVYNFFVLDINLNSNEANNSDGIELGKLIRKDPKYRYSPIIYLTSIPSKIEIALNRICCQRYIRKPYTEDDVIDAINDLVNSPLMPSPEFRFHEPWGNIITSIPEDDILMFESGNNHNIIIRNHERTYRTKDFTLSELEGLFNNKFVRCHRSFLVRISSITDYSKSRRYVIIGEKEIPVGRKYVSIYDKLEGIMR